MRIDFYHLTASPIARVLPIIAERVVGGGGRLVVVAADEDQRSQLDRALWTHTPDSFLPHAQAGGEHDAEQPVLIAPDCAAANGARNIALADGVWREDALRFERAFLFFGEEQVAQARTAWRSLAAQAGAERHYWRQDEGGKWQEAG